MSRALVVMAKAARPGLAKTRLARVIGEQRAAEFARAFLLDTLAHARELHGVQRSLCFAPRDEEAWFRELAQDAELIAQVDGDLGARLFAAFEFAFASGAERVIVIGSDTPQLSAEVLRAAFERLDTCDAVIGPSDDGGYYLLGLRRPCAALFDGVAWSTDSVLRQTLERGARNGLVFERLETSFDIDEAQDFERLRALLRVHGAALCPQTAELLRDAERSA